MYGREITLPSLRWEQGEFLWPDEAEEPRKGRQPAQGTIRRQTWLSSERGLIKLFQQRWYLIMTVCDQLKYFCLCPLNNYRCLGCHYLPQSWVQSTSLMWKISTTSHQSFPPHSSLTMSGLQYNLLPPSEFIPARPQKWHQCLRWEGGLCQTLRVCGNGTNNLGKGWGKGQKEQHRPTACRLWHSAHSKGQRPLSEHSEPGLGTRRALSAHFTLPKALMSVQFLTNRNGLCVRKAQAFLLTGHIFLNKW